MSPDRQGAALCAPARLRRPVVRGSPSLDARAERGVRHEPSRSQEIAAPAASRPEPLLIQTEEIGVRRERRAFADLAEDVDESRELRGELIEHIRKGIVALTGEGTVGVLAQ